MKKEIKEGWEIKTLGEVCEIKGGSTPLKSNTSFWSNGNIPWFTVEDIRNQGRIINRTQQHVTSLGAERLTKFPKDTILLCCTASVGEFAITNIELTSNQQFNGLMIKDKSVLYPQYLFYFVSTLQEELLKLSGKTTIDFVSRNKVASIRIPLPPLSEQQRLVSLLDQEFAKIDAMSENAEKNLQNAKDLFDIILDNKMSLKNGWKDMSLDELCLLVTDGTHKTPKYKETGIPFLSVKNITKGYIDMEDTRFISEEEHREISQRCCPKYGDVLLSKVGTTGVAKVIDITDEFSIFVSLALLKPKTNIIKNTFLEYALNSPYARKQSAKYTRGTANKNFVIKDIKKVILHVPPIEAQDSIMKQLEDIVSICQAIESNYTSIISNCHSLKQSLLRKAFNGEL